MEEAKKEEIKQFSGDLAQNVHYQIRAEGKGLEEEWGALASSSSSPDGKPLARH